MRILHLTDRLSARGGADWHLLGVLGQLVSQHHVVLAVGRDDGSAAAPCRCVRVAGLARAERAEVAADLDELYRELRPDVIHIHNAVNPAALQWAAARGAVATVQDHRCFCPGRGKLTGAGQRCDEPLDTERCARCFDDESYFRAIFSRTLERLAAIRQMRGITVLSGYMKRQLVLAGVPASRVSVIAPFVHGLDPQAKPDGPACVLFVGRLAAAKGVHDAAQAWRLARSNLPLVMAGTGPERQRLEQAGCEVLGWVPHERLSAVYRRAAVLLMPSRWQEPYGIVGPEALSLGVPVVAWDSGGIAEWLPGDGPVPWGDVQALAEALCQAIGRAAEPARGLDRDELMTRLMHVYQG